MYCTLRYTAILTGGEIATPVYSHPYLLLVVRSLGRNSSFFIFRLLLFLSSSLFSSLLPEVATKKYQKERDQKVQVRRLVLYLT